MVRALIVSIGVACTLALGACSVEQEGSGLQGGGARDAAVGEGSAGGSELDGGGSAGGSSAGGGGHGGSLDVEGGILPPSGSSPEICDGIDNDGNGVIDDVDVGGDGICDCLRIATLGLPGTWGEGNIFASWLGSRSDFGAVALNDQVLTRALLDDYDVIVAQDLSKMTRSYSAAEVQALSGWIEAGGGLMTLIGYADPSERANVNLLLAPYGISYESEPILQKETTTIPVTKWVPHPVTEGITKIGVDNGYPVRGSTILASEQGYDLLAVAEVSGGHVLVWGDEWITYDSEWSGHPDYQVERFWLNMIKWVTRAGKCQVAIPPIK